MFNPTPATTALAATAWGLLVLGCVSSPEPRLAASAPTAATVRPTTPTVTSPLFVPPTGRELADLVRTGSIARLQAWLALPGADINARPPVGDRRLTDPGADHYPDESLLDYAAELDRVQVAGFLLDHGARVDAVQLHGLNSGITALHRAAYFNAAEVAELLIARGADVNAQTPFNAPPLLYAAGNGSRDALMVLLAHGADLNTVSPHISEGTAVGAALMSNHVDIARLLVARGALIEPGVLVQASAQESADAVQYLLERQPVPAATVSEALNFALSSAAQRPQQRQRIVELLIAHGADVNSPGKSGYATPLMLAPTPQIAALLIDHGARVNVHTARGGSPVRSLGCNAREADPISVFELLLSHGADLSGDDGAAALRCTAISGRVAFARYLIAHGAPLNRHDRSGRTALFDVVDPEMVALLAASGADVNAVDNEGQTALGTAVEQGRTALVLQLLQSGATASLPACAPALMPTRPPAATAAASARVPPQCFPQRVRHESPLQAAASTGQTDVLRALLDHGAAVDARDPFGFTALLVAARAGQRGAAALLIAHGADVNAHDRVRRMTPLHFAAERNDAVMIMMLLRAHADPALRNSDGLTPQRLATALPVRAALALPGGPVYPGMPTPADLSVCHRIAALDRAGAFAFGPSATAIRKAGNVVLGTTEQDRQSPQDPADDWDALQASPQPLTLDNRPYLIGLTPQPQYLARVDADGVQSVLCRFSAQAPRRELTELEVLQQRAQHNAGSPSTESLKVVGLAGARALLDASRRATDPLPLSLASANNVLSDAISAHRDDVLQFYLDHGVDPNLKWDASRLDGPRPTSPWHDDPLYTAVRSGDTQALELLLEHGASPDGAGDYDHIPALNWAVRNSPLATVGRLLDAGATPSLAPGFTLNSVISDIARDEPRAADEAAAVELLLRHGSDPGPWITLADANLSMPPPLRQPSASLYELRREAMTYRDAADCTSEPTPLRPQSCLPGTLRRALARLETLQVPAGAAAQSAQRLQTDRAWRDQEDRACELHPGAALSPAGWRSYVLTDPARAWCVVLQTNRRIETLLHARRNRH